MRGVPKQIRSDNGPEFTATVVGDWLKKVNVKTLFIEPSSPWENGYVESFNGKLRDELLYGELFFTLKEAEVLIERLGHYYSTIRPHRALGNVISREFAASSGQANLAGLSQSLTLWLVQKWVRAQPTGCTPDLLLRNAEVIWEMRVGSHQE